jgi:hypothetical protein
MTYLRYINFFNILKNYSYGGCSYIFSFFYIFYLSSIKKFLFNYLLFCSNTKKCQDFFRVKVAEYYEFNIRILKITENLC